MGFEQVLTMRAMIRANNRFWAKHKHVNTKILARLALMNREKSKEIAGNNKFKGTLMSMIDLSSSDKNLKFQVIASAPHASYLESGVWYSKQGWWVHREQLNGWLEEKLPDYKGDFIKVGKMFSPIGPGFLGNVSKLQTGIQFMEKGFEHSVNNANKVILEEIQVLGC